MDSRTTRLSLLIVGVAFLHHVTSQACSIPPRQGGDADKIPDIWDLATDSYQFLFEANYRDKRETHYVTETYDRKLFRGRVDVEINGQQTKVVYFNATDEIFEATNSDCKSDFLDSVDESAFAARYGGWNWINKDKQETIVGPSNMFRSALKQWSAPNSRIGKEKAPELVRGMQTNVWTWCYSEGKNNATVKFHFTDPKQENPYGLDGAVPVRVTAQEIYENQAFFAYYEFIGMRVDLPAQELNDLISIPVSIGCQRKAEGLPKPPDYSSTNLYVEAELVYTPIVNNTPGFTYVSNYKFAVDQTSGLAAVEFSPWKSHKEAEMAEPGDDMFRVWDTKKLFVFSIDKTQGSCKVENFIEDFSIIKLPDGYKIDLGQGDIFLMGTSGKEYNYFQETIERGIPASVFEKLSNDDDNGDDISLNQLIVTRYHVANGTTIENVFSEKNAPLKVVYWMYDFKPGNFLGSLTVNFYSFQSSLIKKQEVFDVSKCFTEDSQSKWVQIAFPMNDYQPRDVIPHIPSVVNDYPSVMESFANLLVPYRIPKIIMDVDKDFVYLTVLILERPPFLLDFIVTPNSRIRTTVKDQQALGVSTLQDCAKSCIEDGFCTYFSYCGALCTLTSAVKEDLAKDSIESQVGCALYENMDEENPQTMDQVTKTLAAAVEDKKITLMLSDKTGTKVMDFTAVLFKDDIAFGLEGLKRRPEGMEEERFKAFKIGSKIKDSAADEGRKAGKMSFSSCKQTCLNQDTCETLSYCLATQECSLSSKHADEISNDSLENSTQCMIIGRTYMARFRHFPGLMLNHDAEKMLEAASEELCAKRCVQDPDCKSFDYCPSEKLPCWLHHEHFTDMNEAQHVSNTVECGHYSRRYIDEFTRTRHRVLSSKAALIAGNVTAEQCSRLCRDNVNFQCLGFDLCSDPFSFASTCTLRSSVATKDMTEQSRCDVYTRKATSDKKRVKREVKTVDGHSRSATGGLGFLMLIIGAALGVGGVFGYGYYRANRANRT